MVEPESKTFGSRYKVIKKIGQGAFGIVYLVKDRMQDDSSENLKALKVNELEDFDMEETQSAIKEARMMSKLNHPYIVKFMDSFLDANSMCILIEYCEGGDLTDIIKNMKANGEKMYEERAARWFVQMVLGTSYLHSKKMLHRDLKSSNIYLKNDSIKIGDFGISRFVSTTTALAHTWIGTPYYMSPEALLHQGYNSKSDVWSLGVILYEMCALKRPFTGLTFPQVTKQIIKAPCPKLPDHFSDNLQNILEKILVKEPDNRASTLDLLKTNYMEVQMENIARKITLTATGDAAKAQENSEMIKNLWQRRNRPNKPQTPDPISLSGINAINPLMKTAPYLSADGDNIDVISPRELMILKRKVEADARANELKQAAAESSKNMEIARIRKEKTLLTSESAIFPSNNFRPTFDLKEDEDLIEYKKVTRNIFNDFGFQEQNSNEKGIHFEDDALGLRPSQIVTTKNVRQLEQDKGSDKMTFVISAKPIEGRIMDPIKSTSAYINNIYSVAGLSEHQESLNDKKSSQNSPNMEDRPIKPMCNTAIYDAKFAQLDFKDS